MELTNNQKKLVRDIQKNKIHDFESFISTHLNPDKKPIPHPFKINGVEFKQGDKISVLHEAGKLRLLTIEFVELINYLSISNYIAIISKKEKLKDKGKDNPFILFSEIIKDKKYEEYPPIVDCIKKEYDISDFDKDIKPIGNELKRFIKHRFMTRDKFWKNVFQITTLVLAITSTISSLISNCQSFFNKSPEAQKVKIEKLPEIPNTLQIKIENIDEINNKELIEFLNTNSIKIKIENYDTLMQLQKNSSKIESKEQKK